MQGKHAEIAASGATALCSVMRVLSAVAFVFLSALALVGCRSEKTRERAGIWNSQAAELLFSIAPLWHQTRAFRVLLAASLLLGVWALHRWRIHQLTAQEKLLRDVVET